ncbi:suppressor of fused domain protein [Planctomycetota bacterium]
MSNDPFDGHGDVVREIFNYFDDNAKVKELLELHPQAARLLVGCGDWLCVAAQQSGPKTIQAVIDAGLTINDPGNPHRKNGGPLTWAIHASRVENVEFLLKHGADPNDGRNFIAAINLEDPNVGITLVQMLVEHGGDPNIAFPFGDDDGPIFNALSWAEANEKSEIAEYLRSIGAATPDRKNPPRGDEIIEAELVTESMDKSVVAYFEKRFGNVRPLSLQEIVPTGIPISIHAIPPASGRNSLILFTTGMSDLAMNVPEGAEAFCFGELLIDLPADWPLDHGRLADPKYLWPITWLRNLARTAHEHNTWLGPATMISNGEPPQPLAPNVGFDALFLLAETETTIADHKLQIYRVMPLYPEERKLQLAQGIPALMNAFDKAGVGQIASVNRPNVAF